MFNIGNNSISKGILKALNESEQVELNENDIDHYEKCDNCGDEVAFYTDNTTDMVFDGEHEYCEQCARELGLLENANLDESEDAEKRNDHINEPRLEQKKVIYKAVKQDLPMTDPTKEDVETAESENTTVDFTDRRPTGIVKKLYKVKKENQVGEKTFNESASDCVIEQVPRTMIPKNEEPEPTYIVEDVTDMEEIVPGDVRPPRPVEDVQEILVRVDNRFKKNINESWGHMNIITTSNPQNRPYSSATLSLIRPDNKSYLFSMELNEEENNLYELTVRNQLGKVEYSKKTYNPVHIAERFIKSLLD